MASQPVGSSSQADAQLTCEWENCAATFKDRVKFLSHTQRHVTPFLDYQACRWEGCGDWVFQQWEQFQLHLSIHSYHHQIMNVGRKIMASTGPPLKCHRDSSSRNKIADVSNVLLCGWKECNGEFYDYEKFTLHVDTHAMEDIVIPVMSKELLKTVKFAKCEWVNCDASFKSKSHLKSHLMTHTQKKMIACPVCGLAFCTKNGFLNHCYRQETPTIIEATRKGVGLDLEEVDGEEEPEGILTIDEDDPPPASIMLNLASGVKSEKGEMFVHSPASTASKNDPFGEQSSTLTDNHPKDGSQSQIVLVNLILSQTADNGSTGTSSSSAIEPVTRPYPCQQCAKSFSTKSLLREHTNKHTRRYKCRKCSYAAPFPARLKEHEQYRHNERREFACTQCGTQFKTKQSLRRHELMHTEEEANICEVCGQRFTNYYSLSRHIRLSHFKEQIVFACHLCEKTYNRGNNLSRHFTSSHHLKPPSGWSKFAYEKGKDGAFRLKVDA